MLIALLIFGAVLLLGSLTSGLLALLGARKVRDLADILHHDEMSGTERASEPTEIDLPSLSIIVTARDEAGTIEAVVRGLLRQRHADLEVIVVNDRSADETAGILDRLAADESDGASRLSVIHVRDLPSGWIGKCHACHVGAQRARGDWLLFTDGDVFFQDDDLLSRCLRYTRRQRIDHLAVFPDLRPMGLIQAGLVSCFGQMFIVGCRAYEMDRDLPRGGGGVGAFNLIRREFYDRVGGHSLLRMDLVDDFKLGRLLKEAGARQRILNGAGLIRCPWHRGTANVVSGLEKNLFAGFNFSLSEMTLFSLASLALSLGPLLLGLAATLAIRPRPHPFIVAAAWLPLLWQAAFVLLAYRREARHFGHHPVAMALVYPLSITLLLAAAWNSTFRTLLRGGVLWRETFYPLRVLRQGILRPGVGRRFLGNRSTSDSRM